MTFWPEVPYPTFSLLSYPNDHLYKSRSKKSVYPASHLSHEYVTVPEKIGEFPATVFYGILHGLAAIPPA